MTFLDVAVAFSESGLVVQRSSIYVRLDVVSEQPVHSVWERRSQPGEKIPHGSYANDDLEPLLPAYRKQNQIVKN